MRVLANENFPRLAVEALRAQDHDVVWVRESMPGVDDLAILRFAQQESRLVVTQDKDFGDLAFRSGLPAECGVVLFRLSLPTPEATARHAVAALCGREDWSVNFAVVEEHRIRIRPLPSV